MFVSEQNPIGQLPASQDKLLCHTNSSPPATATGNSCCWICLGMLICWYLNLFRCIQYAGPNWDRQMPQVWHPSFTDAKTCGKESEDVPGIYLNSWRPCFDKKYDGAVLVAFWIHSSCWPSKMKSISSTRKVVLKLVQVQVRVWLSGEIQLVSGALGPIPGFCASCVFLIANLSNWHGMWSWLSWQFSRLSLCTELWTVYSPVFKQNGRDCSSKTSISKSSITSHTTCLFSCSAYTLLQSQPFVPGVFNRLCRELLERLIRWRRLLHPMFVLLFGVVPHTGDAMLN